MISFSRAYLDALIDSHYLVLTRNNDESITFFFNFLAVPFCNVKAALNSVRRTESAERPVYLTFDTGFLDKGTKVER